ISQLRSKIGVDNKIKLIYKIPLRHIYGIDLDLNALKLAKLNLWYFGFQVILKMIKSSNKNISDVELKTYSNILKSILELKLVHGDFLIDYNNIELLEFIQHKYKVFQTNFLILDETMCDLIGLKDILSQTIKVKAENREELLLKFKNKCFNTTINAEFLSQIIPLFFYYEFGEIFYDRNGRLKSPKERGFDIIIGNPPYFTEIRGNKEKFRIYKSSQVISQYYEQKIDIFYLFIERSLDLLKNNGYLGVIILDYWKNRTFGKKLRKKIGEDAIILKLVEFNKFNVFNMAKGQHNSILIAQKLIHNKKEMYKSELISIINPKVSITDLTNSLLYNYSSDDIERKSVYIINDPVNGLQIIDSITMKILDKIRNKSNFSIPSSNIAQGLVLPQKCIKKSHLSQLPDDIRHRIKLGTGIQVITSKTKNNINFNENELKFLRPFYEAHNIDAFYYKQITNKWVLYITKAYIDYDLAYLKKFSSNNDKSRAKIVSRIKEVIRRKYPNIIAHLDQFQRLITSDKKPYGLHRPRNEKIFEATNKIISVRKTEYPKFAYVPIQCYMDQSVIYILINNLKMLKYLLGIFNSKLAWFFFKNTKSHGKSLQIDKDVILKFPIYYSKDFESEIIDLVNRIIDIKQNNNSTTPESLYELVLNLDVIIFQLYGLNLNEVKYVLDYIEMDENDKGKLILKFKEINNIHKK
ncbi:MAG: Eco57I restriction-modification methylase domain-containing protein, partial [Candidatus Helarchaeota archaeon]